MRELGRLHICGLTDTTHVRSVTPKFSGSQCTLANPHSNAAIDLNGDCLAGSYHSAMSSIRKDTGASILRARLLRRKWTIWHLLNPC